MRLGEIVEAALGEMFGRMLWRAAGFAFAALAAIAALYQLTVAGTMALELRYGALDARLIIGGIYLFVALSTAATLWAMRKPKSRTKEKFNEMMASPRTGQIAMLVEAAMVGFTAGKKTPKSLR
jgi:hypothetical protein